MTTPQLPEPFDLTQWKLVPREATEEMIAVGWIDKEDVSPDEIWYAMQAASPTPPVSVWTLVEQVGVLRKALKKISRDTKLSEPTVSSRALLFCIGEDARAALNLTEGQST